MRGRRHGLIGTVLVVLAGVALVLWFQAAIATAILKRVIDSRAGRDITASLPDGLHVGLCGSGSPMPDASRAGPCTLVIAGKRVFMVDTGEGAAATTTRMAIPLARLERVFLTHFHSDHIDGLGPVMLYRWTGGPARSPLPVAGPPGVEAVVAGFNAAYAADNRYRTAHHGAALAPPSGAGAVAMTYTLPPPGRGGRVVLNDAGLTVTAFRVDHSPVSPAVGYRFDYKGRSVVISGDTAPGSDLVGAARGADLLVHEALQPRLVSLLTGALERNGVKHTAQLTRDILDYHTSPEDAARAARAAGVRHLVLNHIVPPVPMRFANPAFLGDAATYFDGPITLGEDGMMFSLPAGSNAITRQNVL